MTRQYTPNVGDKIKLKDIYSYNKYGISLWAWLKVVRVIPADTVVFVRVLDGPAETEQTAMVKLTALQKPIGWKPVHTITCKDIEQARRVRDDWFTRGIHVWASHDLSSAGRMAYTPVKELADLATDEDTDSNPQSPHWQYTGNPVETILPPDCEKFFRIEVLHQWEPELPPTTEKTARRKAIAAVRAEEGVELCFVPDGMGGRMPLCERIETIYEPQEETNA